MIKFWKIAGLAMILCAASAPVLAHHGDAGRFQENVSKVEGAVVALLFINPHSVIVLDAPAPDGSGKIVRWQAEMGAPQSLTRGFGWTKNTLKAGDKITLLGRRVKSGAPYMNLTERAVIFRTESKELLFRTNNAEVPSDVVSKGAASGADSPSY
jgi:hypothetical protein